MSPADIGLIVVFGPLVLAVIVLVLIDYADRRSTRRSRADQALLREIQRRTHMEDRLRGNRSGASAVSDSATRLFMDR